MFDFDLADRVDDLICIFDNGNPDSDMDTITILLTAWITFLFCSVFLVKFIYRKYRHKAHPEPEPIQIEENTEKLRIPVVNGTIEKIQLSVKDDPVKNDPKKVKVDEISKKSPENLLRKEHLLRCSGPEPIVVDFVTASHNWLYVDEERRKKVSETVKRLFLNSMNKIFHGIPQENTFAATVDDLSLSNDLSLQNLFAEYEDFNTIKITCDCEATFTGHLSLSSHFYEQEENTYEFIVNRFIGRLKFLLHIEKEVVSFKFDGWPELCLAVANTSKKNIRLDPKISETITSKLSSAIRNATVKIRLEELENFPILPKIQKKMKYKSGNSFLQIHLKQGVDVGLHKESETGQAYCVIELDDPAQKFQSTAQKLPHPVWNEIYIMNTGNNRDCELLFEVYSSIGAIFLGCYIVSVDQIVEGKKELLHLKSRRMKAADNITGTLEVMFTLRDEVEGKTHVIQQIGRNPVGNKEKINLPTNSDGLSVVPSSSSKNWTESPGCPPIPPTRQPKKTNTATKLEDQYGDERGRRRTRRGEIFTSLRRRFSKERSKSVAVNDGPESIDDLHSNSDFARSVSVDRPGARVLDLGFDSTRSSESELSQCSSHSTTTFMHESSTLLIEVTEHGVKKYYLVPSEEVGSGKWKNKKKLHIFNDHTFVAKRIQSGLSCTVCFGRFPFSLRKQGYQCRDCRLISHKECHIRIPTFCIKSTIYDIDVITV